MSTERDFDRIARAWLELDPTEAPDRAIAAALDAIDRTPQIRRPLRWPLWRPFTMLQIAIERIQPRRAPWRRALIILSLLALLLAAVAAGLLATARPLPQPFGLARNGVIVFADAGDLWSSVSTTARPEPLVTGPEDDRAVRVSPDGRMIAFLRKDGSGEQLVIAGIDGRGLRQLTDDPLREVARPVFSPDGQIIAVGHVERGFPVVSLVRVADGTVTTIDTDGVAASHPEWRPPTGDVLSFRGEIAGVADVYLVRPDGSDLRPLGIRGGTQYLETEDLLRPTWSPDGQRLAYHSNDRIDVPGNPGADRWQVHVIEVATLEDRVVTPEPDTWHEDTEPAWSPDGRSLVVQRFTFGINAWMAVLPADGEGAVVDLKHRSEEYPPSGWRGEFSPDGIRVIAYYDYTDEALTFDPTTGEATDLAWSMSELPTYQRLAP